MNLDAECIRQIAKDSFISIGANSDWQSFLTQASPRILFLGGSVTQGYAAGEVKAYAYPRQFVDMLVQQGYSPEYHVIAAPGMDALTVNALYAEQQMDEPPHLAVIEFAINETTLRLSVKAVESLVRRLLMLPQPPIVCMLLMRNVRGYSCDSFMEPLAEHYGLPCINLRYGLEPQLTNGTLVWDAFADEESHPTQAGHRLLAESLMYLLERAKTEQTESVSYAQIPAPWLAAPYVTLQYLTPISQTSLPVITKGFSVVTRQERYYPTVWQTEDAGARWELTLHCRTCVLFYEVHNLPEYGSCQVLWDGKAPKESVLESYSIYGWGNPKHLLLCADSQTQEHTLTLCAQGGRFVVLGIGYCE